MKNKVKVTIASATAFTIILSSCGISLVKKCPHEGKEMLENITINQLYSDYAGIYDDIIMSTDVDAENYEASRTDKMLYSEKVQQMSQRKNFDQYTTDILNQTINSLEENYDTMYELYNGCKLPSKEQFIISFIENLDNNVDLIVFVDPNDLSDEYALCLQNAQAKFIHETNTIVINKMLSEETIILNIIHELTHSEQDYIFESNDCMQHNMYNIFTEGEAAWRTTFVLKYSTISNKVILIDDNSYFVYGVGASSYSVYSKYYKMLVDLCGYDTLQSCKDKFDYQLLIDNIQSRYSIDAEKFLNCISDVSSMVDIARDHNDMRKLIVAENMYLDCIKQDIEKASSKEEVLNIFNKYRYYKLQYSVRAYDINDNEITNQQFCIEDLEELLFNKIVEFNLLQGDKNRQMFEICLFNLSGIISSKEEISLKNILYFEENDRIYILGKSKKDMKVYDCSTNSFEYIIFDEDIYQKSILLIEETEQKIL